MTPLIEIVLGLISTVIVVWLVSHALKKEIRYGAKQTEEYRKLWLAVLDRHGDLEAENEQLKSKLTYLDKSRTHIEEQKEKIEKLEECLKDAISNQLYWQQKCIRVLDTIDSIAEREKEYDRERDEPGKGQLAREISDGVRDYWTGHRTDKSPPTRSRCNPPSIDYINECFDEEDYRASERGCS